jgi:vacuolar-type H+-ATPase subunit H
MGKAPSSSDSLIE